jgi:hypothetical protein
MKKDVALLRAVASVLLRRHVSRLFAVPGLVIVGLVVAVVWCLKTYGGWWVLCLVVLVPMLAVLGGAWLLSMFMARLLAPRSLKRDEQRDIAGFTDRVVLLTEQARTPLPMLGLRLVRDMLLHRDIRSLKRVIDQSSTLRSDYAALRNKLEQ